MHSARRVMLLASVLVVATLLAFVVTMRLPMATLVQEDRAGFIRARMGLADNQCPTINQNILFFTELLGAKREPQNMAFDANGIDGVTVTDAILLSTTLLGMQCGEGGSDCGDGIKTSNEQCDDGNAIGCDGCSSVCTVEPRYACSQINGRKSICQRQTLPTFAEKYFLDGSGPTGLNVNKKQPALYNTMTEYDGKIYLAWNEQNGTTGFQIRVAVYNGDDRAPHMQRLDGGGTLGLNWEGKGSAGHPFLIESNDKLYLLFTQTINQSPMIRVAVFNGADAVPSWTFVDGNGPTGLAQVHLMDAISLNGTLYVTWVERVGDTYLLVVTQYNGNDAAPVWSRVLEEPMKTIGNPKLAAYKDHLHIAWLQKDLVGSMETTRRFRVMRYDGASSWSPVGATSTVLMNPGSVNGVIFFPFKESLYLGWVEYSMLQLHGVEKEHIKMAAFNDLQPEKGWRMVGGTSSRYISNERVLGAWMRMADVGGVLYLSWEEQKNDALRLRIYRYNGNDDDPIWSTVNHSDVSGGLFHDARNNIYYHDMLYYQGKLYLTWAERLPDFSQQVRFLREDCPDCSPGPLCASPGNSRHTCGNAVLEAPEGCDDGATADGDGCSATCMQEEGYGCINVYGTRSTCLPSEPETGDMLLCGEEEASDALKRLFPTKNAENFINYWLAASVPFQDTLYALVYEDLRQLLRPGYLRCDPAGWTWQVLDGGVEMGLTQESPSSGYIRSAHLKVVNDVLYAYWNEMTNVGSHSVHKMYVARFNGNTESPAWSVLNGSGLDGLDKTREYAQCGGGTLSAAQRHLCSLECTESEQCPNSLSSTEIADLAWYDGKLYATWTESAVCDSASCSNGFMEDAGGWRTCSTVGWNLKCHALRLFENRKVRVGVWNGSTTAPAWRYVDPIRMRLQTIVEEDATTGLFSAKTFDGVRSGLNALAIIQNSNSTPHLSVRDDLLFSLWEGGQAVYNGNDDRPAWTVSEACDQGFPGCTVPMGDFPYPE